MADAPFATDGDGPSPAHTITETRRSAGDSQQVRTFDRDRIDAGYSRGDPIGRYVVLDRIGAGGMGIVYAAYDPDLDRKVALKLLRPDAFGTTAGSVGEARLLREARALAKVAAPNVVAVHDIGKHDDQIYIAMEHIAGRTLAAWLKTPRDWGAALEVFVPAGRGLAAAHAAGLVHRDFKPDNVMLAHDGRILVMDFGLVRDVDADPAASDHVAGETRSDLPSTLTRAGAVMGTPAYMAPEQHLSLAIDARTDQFAFCVALHEALYGRRPFVADCVAALVFKVTEGNIEPPPAGSKVPAWLRRVVLRGLSPKPEDRFASMSDLLAALTRDPTKRRRRASAAAFGVAIVTATLWGAHARSTPASLCAGAADDIATVWNDARRDAAARSFAATDLAYAPDTWRRVEPSIDAYADRWIAARTEACEATSVRGEQSHELLDRRMACLDRRRLALDTTIEILAHADAAVVDKVVAAVADLPALEGCADAAALLAEVPPPDDAAIRSDVAQEREALARAGAMITLGRYDDARAVLDPIATRAQQLAYGPLLAETALALGRLEVDLAHYDRAEAILTDAVWTARASKADVVAAWASVALVEVIGHHEGATDRAEFWLAAATAEVERADDAALAARLARARGILAYAQGRHEEAIAAYGDELARLHELGRGQSIDAGIALNNMASAAYAAGDYARADELFASALALDKDTVGPLHPATAAALGNLAMTARAAGDLTAALRYRQEELAVKERALPADHPALAIALTGLGEAQLDLGDAAAARAGFERALAIRTERFGPDHPDVAVSMGWLGNAMRAEGDLVGALSRHEAAVAAIERTLGPDHRRMAAALDDLGVTLRVRGEAARAVAVHERALAIREATAGREHPALAIYLLHLGEARIAAHELDAAAVDLRRALDLVDAPHGRKELAADVRSALARALAAGSPTPSGGVR